MTATSTIEKELISITKVKKKAREKRPAFLARIADEVNKLSDDEWDGLTEPAQEWANSVATAIDADEEIPDFPDTDDDGPDEEPAKKSRSRSTKSKAADKKTTTTKATGSKKAPPKKTTKSKAADKKTNGSGTRELQEGGIKVMIKDMVIKDPNAKVDDIMDHLKEEGHDASRFTVSSIRAEFRHSLKFLQKRKLLAKDIAL